MPTICFQTALGRCGISWNQSGLTRFRLPEAKEEEASEGPPKWIGDVIGRVRRHLEGQLQDFADVTLDWSLVSDFQRAVYLQAQTVKAGSVKSYGDLSRALGLGPAAARSVGAALGANPWPLIVPCHRIVSAAGKMTGFSAPGGIRTKTRLLAIEGAELLSE
jgi:methylated-DNA-[protein]-cysteine S-methyltransferase